MRTPKLPWQRLLALSATLACTVLAVSPQPAAAADTWTAVGSDRARPLTESQGLTSIYAPSGSPNRYTGLGTIPLGTSSRGWNHVGDPDASPEGYYIEPYQSDSGTAKMFRVQRPDGTWAEYTHQLATGEASNNSFDTIAPGGRWMVSGEWGTMTRLLVFPTPGQNPDTSPSQNLPLAATIGLDHAVADIQGCDFSSATTLLCASDDSAGVLSGITKPLVRIDLSGPLTGTDVTGHVTALRQLPLESWCTGTYEVEGIDYDTRTGILRTIVLSPSICVALDSKTWRFVRG
ncbi:hypothetical protein [Streptomyces sp. NPDC093261]|uniref:hypothetical protein n=1 Tax=Streptomyces sp. NPDC093261 TaxID=3366037 RepID=UPI00381D099E